MKRTSIQMLFATVLSLCCIVLLANSAKATTYTVTNTADSGAGSLRAAVAQANSTSADDTINFSIPANDLNCTADGVCTITLTSGELVVSPTSTAGKLTITNSTGAGKLLISGTNQSRVFFVNFVNGAGGANLTLDGVTVTNGNGTGTTNPSFDGRGGGILQSGTLTIMNSAVNNNTAQTYGGGIANIGIGAQTITNSVVNGNTTQGDGGGIYNTAIGSTNIDSSTIGKNTAQGTGGGIYQTSINTLTISNSTIISNTANSGFGGGGLYNSASNTATITNSTFNDNKAPNGNGGGINNVASMSITNSTISENTALDAGGIINQPNGGLDLNSVTITLNSSTDPTCINCAGGIDNANPSTVRPGMNLNNSIVAGNIVTNASSSPDIFGVISPMSSYNLIGNNLGSTGITTATNGNQIGTPANPIDPKLAPLANNGGTTQTQALLVGSPAIDKGNSFGLTTDQRGLTRPYDNPSIPNAISGDGSDIGAFETQAAPTAPTVSVGGRVLTAAGRGIPNAIISVTYAGGSVQITATDSLGRYSFADVPAGETYIFSVRAKHYQFSQPTQVLSVNEEQTGVNFTAFLESKVR